jgi:L-2-hydroxyglutarate oxidase LhgO
MHDADCIVAGAGVVGLAIARAMARGGREVIILEAKDAIGRETSSRNNEVIHAGFLYPAGSLKAQLCRPGREALYAYCRQRGIPHRGIGKLMIATNDQEIGPLRELCAAAAQHGVTDLQWLNDKQAARIERRLRCRAAVYSPSTGIVDAHALMLALLGDAENAGAVVAFETTVAGGEASANTLKIRTIQSTGKTYSLSCRTFVNAAGLGARKIAHSFHGAPGAVPDILYAKGNFFTLSGPLPFSRLIVPVGETLAAGAAFTIDMGQQGKFGPDLEWVNDVDYKVDPARADIFAQAIRRYHPDFDAGAINVGFAGIRPRVAAPDGMPSDWAIHGPQTHGIPGLFHLLGFDTPGLTACIAIGNRIAAMTATSKEDTCQATASSL